MKILWIVNTIFPYPSKVLGYKINPFGGWLLGLLNGVINNNEIELAVATTYNGKILKRIDDTENNVIYYLIPCKNNLKYDKKLEKYWVRINEEFKPNIVHIHGTECAFALAFQNACNYVKNIVSIQGILSVISNHYLSNLTNKEIQSNITFHDLIKNKSIYKEQQHFYERGKIEKKIIKNASGLIGRTDWDYANSYAICNKNKYFFCNEILRDSFYNKQWKIGKVERNSIFISQAGYPIKGFHIVLDAVRILRNKYKNIKVYVAGPNIIDTLTFKNKLRLTSYGRIIKNKIKEYHLEDNIEFLGLLSEEEMLDKMLKCHVFVQGSSIENSSNSLGEAMIIGMPCVASNVGGTSNLLKDKEEGFLYPFGEYSLLSYYVSKIFEDDSLAEKIGLNAQEHARVTHSKIINSNRIIEIYKKFDEEVV